MYLLTVSKSVPPIENICNSNLQRDKKDINENEESSKSQKAAIVGSKRVSLDYATEANKDSVRKEHPNL